MTYEEALKQAVAEGAIRVYRLSDNTAYVYRLKDNQYQARGLYVIDGAWQLGQTMVSAKGLGRSEDGWYRVVGLPRRAVPIEMEEAKRNPGYSTVVLRQCYTCKQWKPEAEFDRPGNEDAAYRNWECNECYNRRLREVSQFKRVSGRKGDSLERETVASPPPPIGKI
jgi:hypothetical protein